MQRLNFHSWLINEAKADKIIVYHGTSPRNYRSIMSQGLIPDHPKRAWAKDDNTSFYSSSRVSLPGIYVTTNLLTAISAAGNGSNNIKDGKLIIVAEIQPKTAFMDEDNLNSFSSVVQSEYMAAALYGALQSNPESEFVQDEFRKYYNKFKNMMMDLNSAHPQLHARVKPLIWDLFIKAVARQTAYADDYTFRKSGDYGEFEKPSAAQAEQEFLQAKEALTKTLKLMANPNNLKQHPFLYTSRVMEPIGFSGANRIIAIVHEPADYKQPPVVLYGDVPDEFIKEWEKGVGRWNPESK